MSERTIDYETPSVRVIAVPQPSRHPIIVALMCSPAITVPVYVLLERLQVQALANIWVLLVVPFAPALSFGLALYSARRGIARTRWSGVVALVLNMLSMCVVYWLAWHD